MVKKLMGHIGEYKKNMILSPVFMIGEVAMDVFIPYLMAFLINNGIQKGDYDYVIKMGVMMLVMVLIGLFCGTMSGTHAAIASTGLARNLRRALFARVQTFSFENIDKFSSSSLITRLTTDVNSIQNSFQMVIRSLVRAPLMMIFALVMSFVLEPRLGSVFLIAIPIMALVMFFVIKNAHVYFKKMFKEYDHLNNDVQENLLNIRTVKAYVREDREIEKFNKVAEKLMDFSKSAEKIVILPMPLMTVIVFGVIIIDSLLGGHFIVNGEMEIGNLTTLFTYALQVMMSLIMISMILVMVVMSMASAERIVEVLDEKTTIENCENPIKEIKDGSIRFEDVSFAYKGGDDKDVLEHINLEIASGETVGILGGTGSSKSTLVQLIPRLYDVSHGAVYVGGVDVRELDLTALRDQVSMVLQKNELFSGTINSNMRWGDANATEEEIRHACELARADEFIDGFELGYESKIEQGGTNVSGGQKQRLCIARALLKKPKILILDDSTSAVDMKTDAMIRSAFANEIPNTTKLIIAQRISSVQDADKIVVLDEGKIAGVGTHEELYAGNKIYKEVYDSQMKGGDDDAA
ncbi:MAG: ABC transporter ATP-binding protein/permease [Lachnospiraceae bacterium]|nr:ABC transporter ATP-binding protein/permease [Lachnospiraceae bacterium]